MKKIWPHTLIMKQIVTLFKTPLFLTAIVMSFFGSVMMDQEIKDASSSKNSIMESLGIGLFLGSGIVIAFYIWRIGFEQYRKDSPREQRADLKAAGISALISLIFISLMSNVGTSTRFALDSGEKSRHDESSAAYDAKEQQAIAEAQASASAEAVQQSDDPTPSAEPSQSTIEQSDDQAIFEESRKAKNGGFSNADLKTLSSFSKLTYAYIDTNSIVIIGSETYAGLQLACAKLEDSYPALRNTSSTAPYFEDLLDRAKDYIYETKEGCAKGFKKNRIGDINESVDNAGKAYGFFDRILSEVKELE